METRELMSRKWVLQQAMVIPAVVIGAITMQLQHVSPALWGQNVACFLFAAPILFLFSTRNRASFDFSLPATISIIVVVTALIAATFGDAGLEGVHRWIAVGPLRLYIASMVLPIAILMVQQFLKRHKHILAVLASMILMVLLTLQPDAAQITGFAIAITFLLCECRAMPITLRLAMIVCAACCVVYSWVNLDGLPPVSYVEGILEMTREIGVVWFAAAIFALLPIPFSFLLYREKNAVVSIGLCLYYIAILVATLFGNFPVPLMGFGVSPILGYLVCSTAVAWQENA